MRQSAVTVVTRKGQITVPAAVRRALKLKEGDRVVVSVETGESGEATLRPVRSVVEMTFGSLRSGRRFTAEEERELAALEMAERHAAASE